MRKITQEKLNKILIKHKLWLNNKAGGKKAYLNNLNLSCLNLTNACLDRAELSNTDLSLTDLGHASLKYTDLSNADLRQTNLSNANLSNANLSHANLRYTVLSHSIIDNVDLRYTNTEAIRNKNIISCQINTSSQNRKITYWIDEDIVTAGCFQSTFDEFVKRVNKVYKDDEVILNRYNKVIEFFEFMKKEYEENKRDRE